MTCPSSTMYPLGVLGHDPHIPHIPHILQITDMRTWWHGKWAMLPRFEVSMTVHMCSKSTDMDSSVRPWGRISSSTGWRRSPEWLARNARGRGIGGRAGVHTRGELDPDILIKHTRNTTLVYGGAGVNIDLVATTQKQ